MKTAFKPDMPLQELHEWIVSQDSSAESPERHHFMLSQGQFAWLTIRLLTEILLKLKSQNPIQHEDPFPGLNMTPQLYEHVDAKLARIQHLIRDSFYTGCIQKDLASAVLQTLKHLRTELKYEHLSLKDSWL